MNEESTIDLIRVAILEDGKYERIGLRSELDLEPDIKVVGDTRHPDEVLELIEKYQADVAIVDLKIYGDVSVGIQTIRDIKKVSGQTKCIVLTAFPELHNFINAFDAGAEGFIRKDAISDQQPDLAQLIRMLAAGGRYYDAEVVEQMRHYLDSIPSLTDPGQPYPEKNPLTRREVEVLRLLAENKSNLEIKEALIISENTVKAHVGNILNKLGTNDRHRAVLIAISRGWLTLPPEQPSPED